MPFSFLHRRSLALTCAAALAAALPPAAAAAAPHTRRPATYSQAYLRSVMGQILHKTAPAAWERATHSALGFVGIDGDRVQVGLPKITPAARAAARRAFGGAVTLAVGHGVVLPPPVRIGRVVHGPDIAGSGGVRGNDTPPFYGGDGIIATKTYDGESYGVGCTSAFDAADPKGDAMIAVGHCQLGGITKWYSGYFQGHTVILNAFEGSVARAQFTDNEPDAMVITQDAPDSYDSRVYYGQPDYHESYHVRGDVGVGKGTKICTDGFYSGAILCGAVITHTLYYVDTSDPLPWGTYSAIVGPEYIASWNKPFCIPGDSGGPVSVDSGSQMEAIGTIQGYNFNGEADTCVINEMSTVLSSLGVSLVTSN